MRLSLTALEDRTVPATVSSVAVLESIEGMGPLPGVSGVQVTLTPADGTAELSGVSGTSGAVTFWDVEPGTYVVSASSLADDSLQPTVTSLTLTVGDADTSLGIGMLGSGGASSMMYPPPTVPPSPPPPGPPAPPASISGSITAVRADGTEAEEGWVAENNDNDNYNFAGDQATSLYHLPDMNEPGAVAGEDDLMPIRISAIAGAPGWGEWVSLDFSSANIFLWRNADKSGGQITPQTQFNPLMSHTVYVEGFTLSSAVGAEVVSLRWSGGPYSGPGRELDRLPITVARITGPQNVPGYSRHTYETIVPGPDGATYGAITGGTQHSVTANLPVDDGTKTQNTLIVNWGEGEVVGTYQVILPLGFGYTRQVNVVKVQLDIAGADNKLVLDGSKQKQTADPRGIDSAPDFDEGNGDPAMYASVRVSRFAGPLVGEQRRGQRFINMGFVQTVAHVGKHGNYISAWTGNAFSMVSSTEGRTYIDVASPNGENRPWYFAGRHNNDVNGERNYLFPNTDVPVLNVLFDMEDAMRWSAVESMVVEGSTVHRFVIKANFMTYFAVHTLETVNNAHDSYTIRASVPWTWNASGNVDGGWVDETSPPGTPQPTGKWTPDNYPNGTLSTPANPKKLAEVTSGEIVPAMLTKATSTTSNQAMAAETWVRTPPLVPPWVPPEQGP